MDPLSFTASLLTVIGTAGVIGNGLRRIVALRNAPKILLALRYEVANLYCILQAVEHLIKQHAETAHAGPIECLCSALENSQESLFKLEDLMKEKLIIEGKDGETRLDRTVWLFSSSKVQDIKDQIRSNRIDLAFALNLLASYDIPFLSFVRRFELILKGLRPTELRSKWSNYASPYKH